MSRMILIVDDEEDIRISLGGILEDEGYQVVSAANGADAIDVVREEVPDLVLLDIWMPGMDGIQTLEQIKLLFPEITVVMMSGHGTIETAVRATRMGAFDFIEKPFSLDKLVITVGNAINLKELRKENLALRLAAQKEHELVGITPAIENLRTMLQKIAPASAPVLIYGESGVGKELTARLLHYLSRRRDRPFVAVNCMAIPAELLHAELFGYEQLTDSVKLSQKRGRLDLADGGTLFLDDVQELPPAVQSELLRLLVDGCFERHGAHKPVRCDIRLVVASSGGLEDAVKEGRFLADLYSLLQVVPIHVCPLRERSDDIPLLIKHFVRQFHQKEGWELMQFHPAALSAMQSYNWPGNVRELKNMVERLLITSSGPVIGLDDLPDFVSSISGVETDGSGYQRSDRERALFHVARSDFEREFILQRLEALGWDMDMAASSLGLDRAVLHRKLVQYNLSPEAE